MPRDPAAAARAKERKERKLLEAQMKGSKEKCDEGRLFLEPVEPKAAPNYAKAILSFDAAIELYPENFEAFLFRGTALKEQQKFEPAIEDYTRALTINMQCVPALEGRAACYEALKMWDHCIRDYTAVVELQPHNDHAHNMRGCARLHKRPAGLRLRNAELQAVIDDFTQATRLNENNYHAFCNLGRVLAEHKRYPEAIKSYSKAALLRDDYNYATYRRGCAILEFVEMRRAQEASGEPMGPEHYIEPSGLLALPDPTAAVAAAAGASSTAAVPPEVLVVQQEEERQRQLKEERELLTKAIADFTRSIPQEDRLQLESPAIINRAVCYMMRSRFAGESELCKHDLDLAKTELQQCAAFFASQTETEGVTYGGSSLASMREVVAIRQRQWAELKAKVVAAAPVAAAAGGGAPGLAASTRSASMSLAPSASVRM